MRSKKGLAQGHRASQRPFFFLFFFFPVAAACPFVPTGLVGHNPPHPLLLHQSDKKGSVFSRLHAGPAFLGWSLADLASRTT